MSWIQGKITTEITLNLSNDLFEGYLKQNYLFHLANNSTNLFKNINTELDRISTDEISLANAETGIYVPINQNSPSRPNGNVPYAISEFYGYNNEALPGFPVTDGLILALDAGDSNSYPGFGNLWTNLFPGNNGTLTNGPTFNGGNQGSIVFDGIDDYVNCGIISNAPNGTADRTIQVWVMDTSVNDYTVLASYSGYGYLFKFCCIHHLDGTRRHLFHHLNILNYCPAWATL